MDDNKEQSELLQNIDIKSIIDRTFNIFKRFFWLVLLFAAVGASIMWYKAKNSYRPYYQSEATCTINSDYSGYSDANNLVNARNLSNMFQYLVATTTFRDMLKKELGTEQINGTIGAYVSETSNLLTISVTSNSPEDAYNILLATIKCYPDIADYVVGKVYFHMITPASIPREPANAPDYKSPAKRGAMVGAFAALALFVLMALFDNRVNDIEDIEKRMNVKCLGVVPEIKFKERRKQKDIPVTILNDKVGYSFKESYRTIRTKVKKFCDKNDAKVIIITSAVPGEGKTTTAVNIALSLAESSGRVVLVDADLRKPAVAQRIKADNIKSSIGDVLEGKTALKNAFTDVEGSKLKIIPGTGGLKNAIEIMGSEKMKSLIDELRESFDYVIIDTPPCGIMSDAAMIAKYADGIVMVIRCNTSKVSYVSSALSSISGSGIPVVGGVLNCKRNELTDIASGYKYGSYKYGYSKYGKYSKYGRYGRYGSYGRKTEDTEEK